MESWGQLTVSRAAFGGRIRHTSMWRQALAWLLFRLEVRRQRRALSTLTRRQLADIGLTPEQVRQECATPFWRN